MAISTPSSLLSEEKQKELKTLSSQTIACEGKALWSQIKGDSQEVSNTLLGKKKKNRMFEKGHSNKMKKKSRATMQNIPV